MNYGEGLSASDVALLSGRNNNDGAFGGEGSWAWILVFLIFALGGWGNGNGFGNRGGNNGGVMDNYVLASDFANLSRQLDSGIASLERKGDSINNGLCDGFYAMNTGMLNGFSGVHQTLCQGFGGLNTAISTQGYETRLGTQNLASQLADCCCTTQRGIDGVNYNMAMNTSSIQQTLCSNTRDLIENQNANYRALHDEIVANRIEDKNAQIQAQQNEINALRLAASQSAQNEYLLNSLRNGCPVNAQLVCGNQPVPVQYVGANCACNSGYTNGCGCNGL